MLKTAKITMDYEELQDILNRNKEMDQELKQLAEDLRVLEEGKYITALDEIEGHLQSAKKAKTLKEAKNIMDLALVEYCKAFDIPVEQIID